GITDSWDEIVETLQGAPVSTDTELGGYMRDFKTRVRQDTDEIYMRLDDEQNASDLVRGKVMSLRTTILGQMTKIRKLHAAERMRQIGQQGLAGGPTQPELPEEAGSSS
nr:hypothetical protein [Tanacetum cinerariifolium]